MFRFTVRKAALLGAVLAAVTPSARADVGGCAPPPCAPAAPQFRTVYVTECVPETYQARRVVYTPQTRVEHYTAHRCESVPVVREHTYTVYRQVPVTRTEVRRVCVNVPVCEERTVMRPVWTTQTCTVMRTRCVDRGHYECREVYSHRAAMRNRLHGHRRHGHGDCCEPCPPPCPPPTKTVKVWVPCKVQEQYPVTTCRRVCTMQPTVVRVTVCRPVWQDRTVTVCTTQCVPEQRVCRTTVMTTRTVPYQATRTVTVCVPSEQLVTCTRMVTRCVARQVPVAPCEDSCFTVCCSGGGKAKGHGHGRRFGGRGHGHRGGSCCD
jgi:hypothetical protein